jgi:acyl-CoA reductase-like NAD-dependent aldehyde dehydrogenase
VPANAIFHPKTGLSDKFRPKFTDLARDIKVGDGLIRQAALGPLANPRAPGQCHGKHFA